MTRVGSVSDHYSAPWFDYVEANTTHSVIHVVTSRKQFSVLFDILLAGFEFVKDAQIFPLLECLARIALPHGRMCTYKPQNLSECSIRLATMTIPTDPVSRHQWNEDFERKLATIFPKHGRVVSAVTPSFLRIARMIYYSTGI
ncbi:hypothetical protein QCA50_013713 [Cerrena zonata]|uniref:Uncharacterized protein n=1 Tax=Cerrena zonata TaxID=2478898 RepID=A0AAW0G099_9APHY